MTEEDDGYKTDSDEDTIYEIALRSQPYWYCSPIFAQLPVQDAQYMSQKILQNTTCFGSSSCASGEYFQGYNWFQQNEDAYSWDIAQPSNIDVSEYANSVMPLVAPAGFEARVKSTGAELTRTQRRRAERRRAEQRQRSAAAAATPKSDHFEENASISLPSEDIADSTWTLADAADSSEITRTQRRRLQRRRAEQRLQMERRQIEKDSMEAASASSAFVPNQDIELLKIGRCHRARRKDKQDTFSAEEHSWSNERWEQREAKGQDNFTMLKASVPIIYEVSEARSTCAGSSCSLCSTPASLGDVSPTASELDDTEENDGKMDTRVLRLQCSEASMSSRCSRQEPQRNNFEAQDFIDEEDLRKMKHILHNITVDNFSSLSQELVSFGIQTTAHAELLVDEIFAKATAQHDLVDVHADLCAMLHGRISNDSKVDFKRILLNSCQSSFEAHLRNLVSLQSVDGEGATEASRLDKMRIMGTVRFVGALLLRKMVASRVMFYIFEELLLQPELPDMLECFASLLSIVAPMLERSRHKGFSAIFDQAKALSNDRKVKPRIRRLLKDVLDSRASGWQGVRAKQNHASSRLEQATQDSHADVLVQQDAATICSDLGRCNSNKAVDYFDKALMHKELASAFGDLIASSDVGKAASLIAAVNVPASMQAEQVCDLLHFMVELSIENVRRLGFKLIAAIFIEGYWMPSAFEDGFWRFARLCCDGNVKTLALGKVIHDEMIPAFQPLVSRGIIQPSSLKVHGVA